MPEQLRRAGIPGPKIIGVDEVSFRKGHTYRIALGDLVRQRPIWFGGEDSSEASMDLFFDELGAKKSSKIQLAVMAIWKAFTNSRQRHTPRRLLSSTSFI